MQTFNVSNYNSEHMNNTYAVLKLNWNGWT